MIKLDAGNFSTAYTDLIEIPSYPFKNKQKFSLPENLSTLGIISFKGKAVGFINDLLLEGNINTGLGKISAFASMNTLPNKEIKYGGKFKTEKFDIGTFLGSNQVGEIALDAKVEGKGTELKTMEESVDGKIQALQFMGYTYHDLQVKGSFKDRQFEGDFASADSNAIFNFKGQFDLTQKIPQAQFTADIRKLDLFKCHLYQADSINVASGKVSLNINGNSLENMNGSLQAENICFLKSNGKQFLQQADVILVQNEQSNSLEMVSSLFDVDVSGQFKLNTIQNSMQYFLHSYFPTFFKEDTRVQKNYVYTDELSFKVRIKKLEPLTTYFNIPLKITSGSILQGTFIPGQKQLKVSGFSDEISYSKVPVKDWFLTISTAENNQIYFNTGFKRIELADSLFVDNFNFETHAENTRSDFSLSWKNNSKRNNAGEIGGAVLFTKNSMDLDLQKFLIYAEDSLWQLSQKDHIRMDSSGMLNFNNLLFSNNMERVKISGKISKDPKDQLLVEFVNFKLNQLNPLIKRSGVDLQGSLNGTANFSDLFQQFVFTTALDFHKLQISGTPIGSGELNSFFDKNKNLVSLNGFFKRDFGKILEESYNNIRFDGYYYPSVKDTSIDIDLHLYQFPISAMQSILKGIFTLDKGFLTGDIHVKGNFKKPAISGLLDLEDVENLKVDYTNTVYAAKGKIKLYPGQIEFQQIQLTDASKKTATIWGNIFHDNFSNMKFDFDINANKFMALNTTALQNNLYYGKAYCTGNIGLYGSIELLTFDINAKTEKGTQLIIPLSGPGEVSENGFIRFVKIDSANKNSLTKKDLSGVKLNLNLEATPDAEVQIIMDAKGGDGMKARGKGNINMNINTNGNFEMYGVYTITEGSYLFTLQNVINKKFDIDEGSNIRWSGDPYVADINITTTYKQRTSLAPFFPEQGSENGSSGGSGAGGDNNKRYPVNCKLFLKNKLMNPDITFGIELPTVSEVLRSQVMGYINNDQELNRQVFSLLLLRSFVTPLQLQSTSGINMGSTASAAGNTATNSATEMLSNQLNGMLSKFTKSVNVGFNYRPSTALSNEEIDVALSTQLFNDKLTLDGNLGVNNNTQQKTSTLIGDLNVDYKLTKDGKVHVKAFNRSNDNFQIATLGGQFTQGAGVFYREEFNSMSDFFKRLLLGKTQSNTTSLPVNNKK